MAGMPTHPHEIDWGLIRFLAYIALGVPVALLYMRQRRMTASTKSAPGRVSALVVFTLACLWPLLLFAMLLANRQSSSRSKTQAQRESDKDKET